MTSVMEGKISKGDKITSVKSVLSSLPLYYLSLFSATSLVVFKLEKMRDFIETQCKKSENIILWVGRSCAVL